MTTTTYTRFVAVSFATMLLLGAVAAPAAAGLPDPPKRPNNANIPVVVNGTYEGGVVVDQSFERTATREVKTVTIDCQESMTLDTGTVTKDSEFGLSLAGPLTDEQVDGVGAALDDLRPPSATSGSDSATIPDDQKGTLTWENTFVHTHYEIYLAGGGEHVGTIHVRTFAGAEVTEDVKDCNTQGRPGQSDAAGSGDDGAGDGSDESDEPPTRHDKYPFQSPQLPVEPRAVEPRSTERPSGGGDSGYTEEGSEFTGDETADEATILLSERLRNADVPGVAERFVAAKRLNVELDGGTVGMRTDDDGHPVSVRTAPYENPDATVTVDDATLRELESARDPATTARRGIAQGRIEYSTSDPVDQAAFHAAEAGLRGASFVRGAASTVGSFARGVTTAL